MYWASFYIPCIDVIRQYHTIETSLFHRDAAIITRFGGSVSRFLVGCIRDRPLAEIGAGDST